MDFRIQSTSHPLFSYYTSDSLVFGGAHYRAPISVFPDTDLGEETEYSSRRDTTMFDWVLSLVPKLLNAQADVILVDTGMRLCFPSLKERQRLYENGLVQVEWMDTPAACRTYNVLVGEGRKVAGLFWIEM